jgi:predicted Na+-dependent transporter
MLSKVISSFSFSVIIAVILGLIFGDIPYGNELATLALFLAMTFSISNISIRIKIKEEYKELIYAFLLNYAFLSSIIIAMGFFMKKYFEGFIVMASVPPAILVVPLSGTLKGEKKHSLFSLVFLYILSIFLMPFLILLFLSEKVNNIILIKNIFIMVILPIFVSRLIYRKIEESKIKIISNAMFFIIIFTMVGKNRNFLFEDSFFLILLASMMAIRTFGTGGIVKIIGKKFGVDEKNLINYALFSSFKNEGLVMLLASSLFGYYASIPAVVALIFEVIWICCMETKIV